VQLADAPGSQTEDGTTIALAPALLRGDPRLEALFAPFRECVVLYELLTQEASSARASRLLMAEVSGDHFDDVCAVVRQQCPKGAFEEQPTELDDVAAGAEWKDRSGSLFVSVYRLFGGSTSLHVMTPGLDSPEVPLEALAASPLSDLAELVRATSWVEHISCSRSAGDAPRWHLQAALRDGRHFDTVAPGLASLGFETRGSKHWRDRLLVQPLKAGRWLAALPGIDFAA
jgi:hypothetical protein